MRYMAYIFTAFAALTVAMDLIPNPLAEGTASWHLLRSLAGKFTTMSAAMLFFTIVDHVMLRWLDIREVLDARGRWHNKGRAYTLRDPVVMGWFLLGCAIVVGFAWGGAY